MVKKCDVCGWWQHKVYEYVCYRCVFKHNNFNFFYGVNISQNMYSFDSLLNDALHGIFGKYNTSYVQKYIFTENTETHQVISKQRKFHLSKIYLKLSKSVFAILQLRLRY